MDARFADVFNDYNLKERLEILGFGSRQAYLEANETIQAKAADLVEHYVAFVFPNGFKAQVVAVSREAAVRYKTAIDAAAMVHGLSTEVLSNWMTPPMRMIPLIALDPDIKGVCSTAGMFLITSKPNRRLSATTNNPSIVVIE